MLILFFLQLTIACGIISATILTYYRLGVKVGSEVVVFELIFELC